MLELLIDNIFAMLGGRGFQQTVGIHMGTNCASLLHAFNCYWADVVLGDKMSTSSDIDPVVVRRV
jgi:hypothetical protein